MNEPTIWTILQTLSAPAAVLVATVAIGIQIHLQHKQLRQNLFDKRFQVYLAAQRFVQHMTDFDFTKDHLRLLNDSRKELYTQQYASLLLFRDSRVFDYLLELSNGFNTHLPKLDEPTTEFKEFARRSDRGLMTILYPELKLSSDDPFTISVMRFFDDRADRLESYMNRRTTAKQPKSSD